MTPVRLAVGLAVLLAAAGCAAGPQESPAPAPAAAPAATAAPAPAATVLRIAYRGGQATGDVGTVPVEQGRPVQIVVTSDAADEVHLHGYDEEAELVPGRTTTLAFTADVPGEFELELHGSGAQLATLQVR